MAGLLSIVPKGTTATLLFKQFLSQRTRDALISDTRKAREAALRPGIFSPAAPGSDTQHSPTFITKIIGAIIQARCVRRRCGFAP
jgi:hypothetical protein